MKLREIGTMTAILLLVASILTLASNVKLLKASGTIYIRPDGSVAPDTAPISSADNITYTFTDNIHDEIVVERHNIVVDGADYTVKGTGEGNGIYLECINNVTLKNVEVLNFNYGIRFYRSHYNVLAGNSVLNNTHGIALWYSDNNVLVGNIASNNTRGITLASSSDNNVLTCNTASNNTDGIYIYNSKNAVFHNNFINNEVQVYSDTANTWNAGYPSEGNYWSNYNGSDSDFDGIGDTPYVIYGNNNDSYPLMGMFYSFDTPYDNQVNVVSNSSISDFNFGLIDSSQAVLTFNATGNTGAEGFCRICIPKALINGSYVVKFNGEAVAYPQVKELPCSNETYEYLYINYTHSEHRIEISGTTVIPEFPTQIILPLFMAITILATFAYRTKRNLRTD